MTSIKKEASREMSYQAVFSFSPDGGNTVYAFTPGRRSTALLLAGIGIVLLGLSLALVGAGVLVVTLLHFFLTASLESLTRLALPVLAACITALTYKVFRSAFGNTAKVMPDATSH